MRQWALAGPSQPRRDNQPNRATGLAGVRAAASYAVPQGADMAADCPPTGERWEPDVAGCSEPIAAHSNLPTMFAVCTLHMIYLNMFGVPQWHAVSWCILFIFYTERLNTYIYVTTVGGKCSRVVV